MTRIIIIDSHSNLMKQCFVAWKSDHIIKSRSFKTNSPELRWALRACGEGERERDDADQTLSCKTESDPDGLSTPDLQVIHKHFAFFYLFLFLMYKIWTWFMENWTPCTTSQKHSYLSKLQTTGGEPLGA